MWDIFYLKKYCYTNALSEKNIILCLDYLILCGRNLFSAQIADNYYRRHWKLMSCLRMLPFRDIVLEYLKLPSDLLSAFPIGPHSVISLLDSNVAYHWRTSYSVYLGVFNLEDGIFMYGSFLWLHHLVLRYQKYINLCGIWYRPIAPYFIRLKSYGNLLLHGRVSLFWSYGAIRANAKFMEYPYHSTSLPIVVYLRERSCAH